MNTEQATIEQMNEAIATFLGGKVMDDLTVQNYTEIGIPKSHVHMHDFDTLRVGGYEYHTSWDWLMPVVEKIATVCPDDVVHMEFGKTYTRCNLWNLDNGRTHVFDEYKDTPILTVYHAVYQFIQWYNSNKS